MQRTGWRARSSGTRRHWYATCSLCAPPLTLRTRQDALQASIQSPPCLFARSALVTSADLSQALSDCGRAGRGVAVRWLDHADDLELLPAAPRAAATAAAAATSDAADATAASADSSARLGRQVSAKDVPHLLQRFRRRSEAAAARASQRAPRPSVPATVAEEADDCPATSECCRRLRGMALRWLPPTLSLLQTLVTVTFTGPEHVRAQLAAEHLARTAAALREVEQGALSLAPEVCVQLLLL